MIHMALHLLALVVFIVFIKVREKEETEKINKLVDLVSKTQQNVQLLKEYTTKPLLSKGDKDTINDLYKTINKELIRIELRLRGYSTEQEESLESFWKKVRRELAEYMVEDEENGDVKDD